jgi:Protein kinase domain
VLQVTSITRLVSGEHESVFYFQNPPTTKPSPGLLIGPQPASLTPPTTRMWVGSGGSAWTSSSTIAVSLPSDAKQALAVSLSHMSDVKEPFLGTYLVLSAAHRREGGQGVVQFVQRISDQRDFVVKFLFDSACFARESEFYRHTSIRNVLPDVEAMSANADGCVRCSNGFAFPPFIIAERGESLNEWTQRVAPDDVTSMFVLCHVVKRLQQLHGAGLSHRDLKPANILWRPSTNSWTLIDFGCGAWIGAPLLRGNIGPSLACLQF